MSYVYKLKNIDLEKLNVLGYEKLPEDLCPAPLNEKYLFKVVMQPKNGECVLSLIDFYNKKADEICANKKMRKLHAQIGIKFRKKKGKYHLVMNPGTREMFMAWRIELDLEDEDVYFTISDGSMPRFYDAEKVIEKYCKEEIEELVLNGLAYKEEIKQVQ